MATEVAKKEEGALPAALMKEMEADAKKHQQVFDASMLIIPRINILQDLSPQVKERRSEYVPGAKAGMIYNNVTNTLDNEIFFIPSKFAVRYIAWEENRGGLVDQTLTKEEVVENFEEVGIGQWTGLITPAGRSDAKRCDIIETPEWVGIAHSANFKPMPVAISFPITKAKSARKINTAIDLAEVEGKNGPFKPPAFYHAFRLGSAIEQSGENEWYGWTVQHLGWAEERLIHKAKDLKEAFDKGEAQVAEEGAQQ